MQDLRRMLTAREVQARVVADAVTINVALLVALATRFIWTIVADEAVGSPRAILHAYLLAYLPSAVLLTLLALMTFSLSGFYTRGRAYRGRYKALMVVQAVTTTYLLFVLLSYLSREWVYLPRTVLPLAWAYTAILILGGRLWSSVWKTVVQAEPEVRISPEHRRVQSVLVIGGDGYIGSALLPKLLDRGLRVRILSLLLYGTEPIEQYLDHPRVEIIQADFRQVDKVVEAMRGMDAVIHLGAIVGDPACALDEELTIDVNVVSTRMIAEVAKGQGVNRFVFASTCSVYGASDEVLDENSMLNPVSLYARSKIACERILEDLAGDSFAPVLLRFGTIYGLSGRTRFDLVVNLLAAKAMVEGEITVVGGDQWRPFVHVDDAALAVLKVLLAPLPLVRNEVFNVGSDHQNFTIQEIGEMIHRMVPSARLINWGTDGDQRNYRVNFQKIRNVVGFEPKHTIEYGIREVMTAIQTGQVKDYRDPKYSNVKFLSEEGFTRLVRRESNWAHDLVAAGSSDTPKLLRERRTMERETAAS